MCKTKQLFFNNKLVVLNICLPLVAHRGITKIPSTRACNVFPLCSLLMYSFQLDSNLSNGHVMKFYFRICFYLEY